MMTIKVKSKMKGRCKMANEKVKEALKVQGLRQWELAEMLGISEQTICRRMRKELPPDEQEKIISVIKNHKKAV